MNYCKKCSRLVDSSEKVCPYCSNKLEDADLFNDEKTEMVNDLIIDSVIDSDKGSPQVNPELRDTSQKVKALNDIMERRSGANLHDGQNNSSPPPVITIPPADEPMRMVFKVFFIIFTVFNPIVGLISAIVFMCGKSESIRKFGLVQLIVSVCIILIASICCCVFSSMATEFASEFNNLYMY